jgi:hypothetical protein
MTVLPNYEHPDHVQFVEDMQAAGFEVRHYAGRFFWSGPAVIMEKPQDWQLNTAVKCQHDNLGDVRLVYPQAYDAEGLEKFRDYLNLVGVDFVNFVGRLGPTTGIVLPGVND